MCSFEQVDKLHLIVTICIIVKRNMSSTRSMLLYVFLKGYKLSFKKANVKSSKRKKKLQNRKIFKIAFKNYTKQTSKTPDKTKLKKCRPENAFVLIFSVDRYLLFVQMVEFQLVPELIYLDSCMGFSQVSCCHIVYIWDY